MACVIRIKRKDVKRVKEARLEKSIKASSYLHSVSPETQERSLKQEHYRNKGIEL